MVAPDRYKTCMLRRILIVEGQPDQAAPLQVALHDAGYRVRLATGASELLAACDRERFDLVVIDDDLRDLPGTQLVRQLRQNPRTARVPIVVISSRTDEIDRVVAFEVGADDFVSKPLSHRELSLRIAAILRRAERPKRRAHTTFHLDAEAYRLQIGDESVRLTPRETQVLAVLLDAREAVVRREDLLREVWGAGNERTAVAVDSHIKRLRRKLGRHSACLQTVRGVGYALTRPR